MDFVNILANKVVWGLILAYGLQKWYLFNAMTSSVSTFNSVKKLKCKTQSNNELLNICTHRQYCVRLIEYYDRIADVCEPHFSWHLKYFTSLPFDCSLQSYFMINNSKDYEFLRLKSKSSR